MDVSEPGELSNKFKQRNSAFNTVLHFSHSRVFNNENISYPKISVKRPYPVFLSII